MNNLLWFVLGIVFIVFILPILESISVTIQSYFEVVKSKMSVVITQDNKEIRELNADLEQSSVSAIGFHAGDDSEYYDDDECKMLSSKNSIGFNIER